MPLAAVHLPSRIPGGLVSGERKFQAQALGHWLAVPCTLHPAWILLECPTVFCYILGPDARFKHAINPTQFIDCSYYLFSNILITFRAINLRLVPALCTLALERKYKHKSAHLLMQTVLESKPAKYKKLFKIYNSVLIHGCTDLPTKELAVSK